MMHPTKISASRPTSASSTTMPICEERSEEREKKKKRRMKGSGQDIAVVQLMLAIQRCDTAAEGH